MSKVFKIVALLVLASSPRSFAQHWVADLRDRPQSCGFSFGDNNSLRIVDQLGKIEVKRTGSNLSLRLHSLNRGPVLIHDDELDPSSFQYNRELSVVTPLGDDQFWNAVAQADSGRNPGEQIQKKFPRAKIDVIANTRFQINFPRFGLDSLIEVKVTQIECFPEAYDPQWLRAELAEIDHPKVVDMRSYLLGFSLDNCQSRTVDTISMTRVK